MSPTNVQQKKMRTEAQLPISNGTEATALLSNYRQAPRKVALLAGLVRGKRVESALASLAHVPKRAAEPLAKLILSAVANARAKGMREGDLVISRIEVGGGVIFRRTMPRARGRGAPIRKKTSHISLSLAERPREKEKVKKQKSEVQIKT